MTPRDEALRALVGTWREDARATRDKPADDFRAGYIVARSECADELDAVLAATPDEGPTKHNELARFLEGSCMERDNRNDELACAAAGAPLCGYCECAQALRGIPAATPDEGHGKGDIHVLPVNDTVEHVELRTCWCRPTVQAPDDGTTPIITHHSADSREYFEPEAQLLRLGERASRWFADGTRTDEPLDIDTAVKCIDGALGALEAQSRPAPDEGQRPLSTEGGSWVTQRLPGIKNP